MTAFVLTALAAFIAEIHVARQPDRVVVTTDQGAASTFFYGDGVTKPYLWPLTTAAGVELTRHWPMQDAAGDPHDHPHQRGVWFAHADVNGIDFWNSDPSYHTPNMGRTTVDRITPQPNGFAADLTWRGPNAQEVLKEHRVITFGDRSPRTIDFDITLTASTDCVFGDEKDGVFGVRLAHELEEPSPADPLRTGKMTASNGCHQEKECWGKRADWLDVTGTIGGREAGITVIDNPGNPRHPTYWHARGYGLLAANIFAVKAFMHDPTADGSMRLQSGKSLRFRYRIVLHDGPLDVRGLDSVALR